MQFSSSKPENELAEQKEYHNTMQNCSNRIDQYKVKMAVFMVFQYHGKQPACAAAALTASFIPFGTASSILS